MSRQLYIRTSGEYLEEWNKDRIVNALIRETYIDQRTAEMISNEVEQQIISLNITILTSTLIRELVSAKLIELGLEKAHKMHTSLGVPLYDVDQMILHRGASNGGYPLGPELTNLALANRIKREYALMNVFSQQVADAHLRGDIYVEGLECIDRLYCVGLSLEYMKKFGLNLPESGIKAKPPKHPGSLISQMVGFTEILRGHVFYSIEWDAVNTFFAPYSEHIPVEELKQFAQKMVFELSRQSMSLRVPTLLNLYWHIPGDLADVPVIGPSHTAPAQKKPTYSEYQQEAQRVLMTLLDALMEGDAEGKVFALPMPVIHLSDKLSEAPGAMEFLTKFAQFILEKGHASVAFERKNQRNVFRSFDLPHKTIENPHEPWQNRHAVIHTVRINLPRFGYIARGSDMNLFTTLTEMMELAAEAHMQKRVFLEKLLAAGKEGPLGMLMMKQDGSSFLQLEEADFLIGLTGLNELVQIHKGRQFHESDEAVTFGSEIVAHLSSVCERLSQRHHISFSLTGFPSESASSRLARLDLRYHSPDSGYVVKGDLGSGKVHYTDSICVNPSIDYPLLKRMKIEGSFSQYLHGGVISKVPVKGTFAHKKDLITFLTAVLQDTDISQIYFPPEASSDTLNFLK